MTIAADFHARYVAALRAYLAAQGEDTLAVGHELGRRALQEQISMLDIVENHHRLVDGPDSGSRHRPSRCSFCCRRWRHSTWQRADSLTAQDDTNNSGPAPTISPTVTNSTPRW
jgi:hypothetical protein